MPKSQYEMNLQINWSIIPSLSVLSLLSLTLAQSSPETVPSCVKTVNGNTWKLVYSDEFTGIKLSPQKWAIEHEAAAGKCHGNHIHQHSCNTRDNIQLVDGHLVLLARHEPYNENNFTAGGLNSRTTFGMGRFEMRASQPAAFHLQSSLHSIHPKDTYWHENGQVDLVQYTSQQIFFRGLHPSKSKDQYKWRDMDVGAFVNLHDFHLYGMEWNETQMTYFFNDIYSEPILFNSSQGWLNPGFTLRLQLGVVLDGFKRPFPANLSRLTWKCPAYVIDYLRVYQVVNLTNETNVHSNCEAILENSNEDALQTICQMARGSETTYLGPSLTTTESPKKAIDYSASSTFTFSASLNWLLGFTLCLALSILVIYLLVKKTSKPANESGLGSQIAPIEATEDQYEIPLYEVYEVQSERYTDLNRRTSRDYVAIKS